MPPAPPGSLSAGEVSLADLRVESNLGDLVTSFVPPDRFAAVSFGTYYPSPAFPSQASAANRLRRFAEDLNDQRTGPLRRIGALFGSKRRAEPLGLYLDGGFGVGKTHLLAAAHGAARVSRVYLSLSELAQTVIAMGLSACVETFRRCRLICVDEFELDDVAGTRIAASFLRGLWADGGETRVVVTSNTLPSDLGRGRFSADDFAREIGEIAAGFEVVRIDGEDYRHRASGAAGNDPAVLPPHRLTARFLSYVPSPVGFVAPGPGAKVLATHDDLLACLVTLHPIHYGQLARSIDALFVENLSPIPDQDAALRFVGLVDKLYDWRVRLFVSTASQLSDVFPAEYRHGSYSRKYGRCLSRLHELLAESAAEDG